MGVDTNGVRGNLNFLDEYARLFLLNASPPGSIFPSLYHVIRFFLPFCIAFAYLVVLRKG